MLEQFFKTQKWQSFVLKTFNNKGKENASMDLMN